MSETTTQPATPAPQGATVYADVDIAAPPAEVFRALVDPEELARWWGSDDTYRTRDWETDPRPGGAWSVRTVDAAGNEASVHGEFRVVDPPHRLEYTWRASRDHYLPTTVRYDLAPAVVEGVAGTRVTVTHTVTALAVGVHGGTAVHGMAWSRVLRRLATHAAAGSRPTRWIVAGMRRAA